MEGQKHPIVNDEILALQITEDELMKVNSIFNVKFTLIVSSLIFLIFA